MKKGNIMSLETVRQLYHDLALLTPTKADESAYVSMITAFNMAPTDARRVHPHHRGLSGMSEAQAQIPIGDLLTRTGQLQAMLQEEEDHDLAQKHRRDNQARRDAFRLG